MKEEDLKQQEISIEFCLNILGVICNKLVEGETYYNRNDVQEWLDRLGSEFDKLFGELKKGGLKG